MSYTGLSEFVTNLENNGELLRVKAFVDTNLEITDVTDRIVKSGGKAILFENNGTSFPLLINAFGSDRRMAMALCKKEIGEAVTDINALFNLLPGSAISFFSKFSKLPSLIKLASFMPSRSRRRGLCQKVVHKNPDLGILPVLKCWPYDGGRFITLPLVHTINPYTGSTNVGMYRMQVFDNNTTGMHWQMHKTGASHFAAWATTGRKMPVAVTLGGDPVYTYCATAPLPENISEYILAGFLRKKKVRLVKCITNDLYVPADSDIVIEGFVDPSEPPVNEGPFGDHTGFYSLADNYPRFHVTCITHSKGAVYPATIVGIPPMEDAWLAKATEKLFLPPLKLALLPEIADFHMPEAGVAHNLVIVRIRKSYPGQGMKVISSLMGAGQMMFTKYLAVVSGDVDIRSYRELMIHILENTHPVNDILFSRGPLDVLDHSSESFSFGGKAGIDATIKLPEERPSAFLNAGSSGDVFNKEIIEWLHKPFIKKIDTSLINDGLNILLIGLDTSETPDAVLLLADLLRSAKGNELLRIVVAVDSTVNTEDIFVVVWQVLGNSDPLRDHHFFSHSGILIDGTIKYYRKGGFPREWPNVVCSSPETIKVIDEKWKQLDLGAFIQSPSLRVHSLLRTGGVSLRSDQESYQ